MRHLLRWWVVLCVAIGVPPGLPAQPAGEEVLRARHYDVRLRVYPDKQRMEAEAALTFENTGTTSVTQVHFMLYRLLKVQSVLGDSGQSLLFTQNVTSMRDEEAWQVNSVTVTLPSPLAPGSSARVRVRYAGMILGYPEVMAYVRDRIDEKYTLFRAETMPYPILGTPSVANWRLRYPFTYEVTADVPQGYAVVCNGTTGKKEEARERATFTAHSEAPGDMLDIAIAKFLSVDDPAAGLHIFAVPEDKQSAERLLREMKRSRELFTSWFGSSPWSGRLAVIELPDGWGSYATKGYIFQTAAAFNNPESVSELYHEIAHAWNAKPKDELQRTRWFDEAFASYSEALAIRTFQGEKAYLRQLERYRERFVQDTRNDARAVNVPIAEYGKFEIGEYSYTKGAWSLYVLHQTIGDDAFRKAVSRFVNEFQKTPADFSDFRRIAEEASGRNLKTYFDEWIFGTESSKLLIDNERAGGRSAPMSAALLLLDTS